MKRTTLFVLGLGISLTAGYAFAGDAAFDAERQKALANPYANDLGPGKLTEVQLSCYPPDLVAAYKVVLLQKCSKCH